MSNGFFITGTDTGIGKTYVSALLIKHFIAQGERVVGMKPVASGAQLINGQLRNEDALALMQAANVTASYELVNPYCFAPPIAPHIAAQKENRTISLQHINQCYAALAEISDRLIVEGVGGWRVPIDAQHDVADMAAQLGLPVILIVGMRLGCINHALLTAQAITAKGCKLIGWIANQVDPAMAVVAENISTLESRLPVPLLATVAHAMHAAKTSMPDLQTQLAKYHF